LPGNDPRAARKWARPGKAQGGPGSALQAAPDTRHFRMQRRALLALPFLAALPGRAAAQAPWPDRPVRAIVPFPPGGTTDIPARLIAAHWQAGWGQPVVVENRAGGSGVIGTEAAARAAPDGNTLIFGNNQTHAANAGLFKTLPFDLATGFVAIAPVCTIGVALVVTAGLPASTVPELIALAKSRPQGLSYASPSVGSGSHVTAHAFVTAAGIEATHIPYRGAAPAAADLAAGTVDFMVASWASVAPLARQGRVRVLAVASTARMAELPDVPTTGELGFPGVVGDVWVGVFGPAGIPAPIVARINADTARALADPTIRARLEQGGFRVAPPQSPAEYAAFHQAELTRWTLAMREAGVTPSD
jgi:tripartite-type tricarboxylate transporter receptor subunit TctC